MFVVLAVFVLSIYAVDVILEVFVVFVNPVFLLVVIVVSYEVVYVVVVL